MDWSDQWRWRWHVASLSVTRRAVGARVACKFPVFIDCSQCRLYSTTTCVPREASRGARRPLRAHTAPPPRAPFFSQGRPYLIVRDQDKKERIRGVDAIKSACNAHESALPRTLRNGCSGGAGGVLCVVCVWAAAVVARRCVVAADECFLRRWLLRLIVPWNFIRLHSIVARHSHTHFAR